MFNKKEKFKHKKKFNGNREHNHAKDTFDPKIHHRSKGSSGYGLKRDHVSTTEETSGAQLQGMLDKWNNKD
jgi:hypothetical protein